MKVLLFVAVSTIFVSPAFSARGEADWPSGEDPKNLTKLEQIGKIHPALPKTKLLSAQESLFEIEVDARAGDEVMGRVNLANNSFEQARFSITGGSGKGIFGIETFVNSRGKCFGVIKRASGRLVDASCTLIVTAEFENGVSAEQTYTVDIVQEPIAKRFLRFVEKNVGRQGRLKKSAADGDIETWLGRMTPDGSFSDLPYGMGKEGWENTCAGGERLLGFAVAYLAENSRFHKDDKLKANLYRGVVRNAEQNALFRTNWAETHVWRNSDFIAGIGIRFVHMLREEMEKEIGKKSRPATEVYDAILDVCDVMWAERMHERPAIGNANRNHRMRSLITRAALSFDPNRALTDQDVWYDTVDPRIPGYYPNGSLGDVMELIETGYIMMDTYDNRNGFFPDGTICHHPAVGLQFTADAYGWQWLVENSIPMADFLKNTRYRAKNETYDIIADRLLDAYRPLTFDGYLDMAVGGLKPDRSKWGARLLDAVTGLLEAKSADTVIQREEELRVYKTILEGDGFVDKLTLNQPFWNIDYLVHRRPHYLASGKMISTRSRGLERGVGKKSNYYLGDGALFVRVNADDYNGLEKVYNWHAIPGTTAEQRDDALPLDARSAFPGANGTNPFAGVVSDGTYGFGAFVYERNHADEKVNYSTVNANKAFFFFDNEILALGNRICRVRPGDGREIHTTMEQKAWTGDIIYGVAGARHSIVLMGGDQTRHLKGIKTPVWFHHDKVGYVIVPEGDSVNVDLWAESRGKKQKMFQLAVDHGPRPITEAYRYIILPGAEPNEVERFVTDLQSAQPSVSILRNDEKAIAVHHRILKISQMVFFEKGALEVPYGEKETLRLEVDHPALVMLREIGDDVEVSVTDPLHSTRDTVIHLTVDKLLTGKSCVQANGQTVIAVEHSESAVLAGKTQILMLKR